MTWVPAFRVTECPIETTPGGYCCTSLPCTTTRSCSPFWNRVPDGQISISTGAISPAVSGSCLLCPCQGCCGLDSVSSNSRCDTRSQPSATGPSSSALRNENGTMLPNTSSFWSPTNRSMSSAPSASTHSRSFMCPISSVVVLKRYVNCARPVVAGYVTADSVAAVSGPMLASAPSR